MKKIVYDEKYHAEALLEILEMENTCYYCPKRRGHNGSFLRSLRGRSHAYYLKAMNTACDVCLRFVKAETNCPCYELGKAEAIKRTWIALEEKGYI